MEEARRGDKVKVHYTSKLDDGTVFASTQGRNPLELTIGEKRHIAGLENGIVGMCPGERRRIEVPAEKAYGSHLDKRVCKVSVKELPDHLNPRVGQRLRLTKKSGGRTSIARITEVTESTVTIDRNHPLAGRNLTIEVLLLEIL